MTKAPTTHVLVAESGRFGVTGQETGSRRPKPGGVTTTLPFTFTAPAPAKSEDGRHETSNSEPSRRTS